MKIQNNRNTFGNDWCANNRIFGGQTKMNPLLASMLQKTPNQDVPVRDAHTISRMLSAKPTQSFMPQNSLITQSIEYANSLQAARGNKSTAAAVLKKLKYDFKAISVQILRSKTSLNARQVAGKARREVLRLKREKLNGEYDEKEIQTAISHAQAMERVAKKKARNLQLEEMIHVDEDEVTGKESAVVDEMNPWKLPEENDNEDQKLEGASFEQAEVLSEELLSDLAEDVDMTKMYDQMLDGLMEEMNESMEESMEEILEESGLSELAKELMDIPDQNMNYEEYKEYKKKHRLEEMKAMAKADAAYLKAVFERYQAQKSMSTGNAGAPAAASMPGMSGCTPQVTAGAAVMPAAAPVVDVSL